MRELTFRSQGWEDVLHWAFPDKKLFKRLVRLIEDTRRDPFDGIGKPEPLRGDLAGYWSRRIDDEHRLVYRVTEKEIVVLKARYHYE
ncbi:Txe/YoeB family addiction module toxin [Streptomyces sp. MAR4 CNY-716]